MVEKGGWMARRETYVADGLALPVKEATAASSSSCPPRMEAGVLACATPDAALA